MGRRAAITAVLVVLAAVALGGCAPKPQQIGVIGSPTSQATPSVTATSPASSSTTGAAAAQPTSAPATSGKVNEGTPLAPVVKGKPAKVKKQSPASAGVGKGKKPSTEPTKTGIVAPN